MSNLPPPPPPPPPGRGSSGGGPSRSPFERNGDRRPTPQGGEPQRKPGFPRWALYVIAGVLVAWKGGFLLHLVKGVRNGPLLTGNNIEEANEWGGIAPSL